MLRNYDKDSIPSYLIQKLEQRIISDPDFTLDRAKQCSHAVKFLFSWVKAMYDYNKVYLETRPLRQQLEMTQRDLQEKTEFLREKKAQLFEINKKIEQLEAVYNEKIEMREDLKNRILDC
jgi:dynein heavy chain